MKRRYFLALTPLSLVACMAKTQEASEEPVEVPTCPHCGDRYPNLIGDDVWCCNEDGILFKKAEHKKHD